MSRNKLFILGIVCVLVMSISGIYAFTSTSNTTVKSQINTGEVRIELKEYTINNNGKEIEYVNSNEIVMPGEDVSLIPRVINLGASSYIRVKLSYLDGSGKAILSDENINNFASDFKKIGDYWYYTKIFETEKNLDIFKSVSIPKDLGNEYQGATVPVNIIVEAIQAKNFKPDFSSSNPWEEVEIVKNNKEYIGTDKVQQTQNIKIEYENNSDQYINIPDNFCADLNYMMPGDVYKEELTLSPSQDGTEYFFNIKVDEKITEQQINLLKKIQLKISASGKTIYNGNMYQLDAQSLDKYKTKQKLTFEIKVPEELNNEYSRLGALVTWNFSAKTNIPEKEPVQEPQTPQTGDTKIIISIVVFGISAICLILVLFAEWKIRKKDKEN